jgi:hypothetical protein
MSSFEIAAYVQKSATEHPFMAGCLGLFLVLTFVLGIMHEGAILGELTIVIIQQFKQQARELADVGGRLKKELMTWKVDR